jgi:predicted peroxiredoxin
MPRFAAVLTVVLAVAVTVAAFAAGPAPEKARVPIVINMTAGKEDLHSFWMGLQLASHALADGRQATVYMNVNAPFLASKKAPEDLRFGELPTPREQIAELLKKGAKIIVCPGCLKVAGLTKEDLLPGLVLGTKEALFGPLDQGGAVFSY